MNVERENCSQNPAKTAFLELVGNVEPLLPELRCWVIRRALRFEPETNFDLSCFVGRYRALIANALNESHQQSLTPWIAGEHQEFKQRLLAIAEAKDCTALQESLTHLVTLIAKGANE